MFPVGILCKELVAPPKNQSIVKVYKSLLPFVHARSQLSLVTQDGISIDPEKEWAWPEPKHYMSKMHVCKF